MNLLGFGDNVMDAYLFQNKLYPGGNAANVSVLAKRAGAKKTGYLGVLADDAPGRHFKNALETEAVDLSRIRIACGRTAMNYITLNANGERLFTGNNGCDTVQNLVSLKLNHLDREYAAGFDILHTSIHSLVDEELPALSHLTCLSMDFSSDGYTHVNVADLSPLLTFAFFSAGDKTENEVKDFAHFASECGARNVIFTMGLRGSYILSNGVEYKTPATILKRTVDTLGAGDAFIAAFLVSYQNTNGNIEASARAASVFSADCCQHYGAFGHEFVIDLCNFT